MQDYGQSVKRLSFQVVESMVEQWANQALATLNLESDFEIQGEGGSDSTNPDIKIVSKTGDYLYVEVKKDPPAAGFQTTLKLDKSKNYVFASSSGDSVGSGLLNVISSNADKIGKRVQEQEENGSSDASGYSVECELDTETEQGRKDAESLLNVLRHKFIESGTQGFVSVRENGQVSIFNPQNINDLREYINPSLVVRPKYSGSGSLSFSSKAQAVQELLDPHGLIVEKVEKSNGKTVCGVKDFDSLSSEQVKEINSHLDTRSRRDNFKGIKSGRVNPFIGVTGEIRGRSETMSMTALMSLALHDNAPSSSSEQFVEFIGNLANTLNS